MIGLQIPTVPNVSFSLVTEYNYNIFQWLVMIKIWVSKYCHLLWGISWSGDRCERIRHRRQRSHTDSIFDIEEIRRVNQSMALKLWCNTLQKRSSKVYMLQSEIVMKSYPFPIFFEKNAKVFVFWLHLRRKCSTLYSFNIISWFFAHKKNLLYYNKIYHLPQIIEILFSSIVTFGE